MPTWITVTIVACALMRHDTNLPTDGREQIALVEAHAFIDSQTQHASLLALLAIGYVETRFNPTGSQSDRDHGWWGVMQISAPELRCWGPAERIEWRDRRHHRHFKYVRHDDATRCTEVQLAERTRLLDPAINIQLGARLLERRWIQAHSGRHSRRLLASWEGAYYWGSIPVRRRDVRRYLHYARLVHRAEGIMQRRLETCREQP